MKIGFGLGKNLALAIICWSTASFADGPVLVNNPTERSTGLSFSFTWEGTNGQSSEDGICKVLGYNKALYGSSKSDYSIKENISVNEQGEIIGSPDGWPTTQIYCMGSNSQPIRQIGQILNENQLKYPRTSLSFSHSGYLTNGASSEHGVCKILGFEKGVAGSGRSDNTITDTVELDANGNIRSGPSAWRMTRVVCLNRFSDNAQVPRISVLTGQALLFPGSNLPFSHAGHGTNSPSSEHGVCKAVGFRMAVQGSSRTDDKLTHAVQVDANGQVLTGAAAWRMTQIVCFQ